MRSRPRLMLLLAVSLLAPFSVTWAEDEAPPEKSEQPRQPMLWVVDSEPTVYLFGTIHVPDQRVHDLQDVVKQAKAASDKLYTEILLEDGVQMQMAMRMMLPPEESLDTILPPELWERVKKLVDGKIPEVALKRLKVWTVNVTLATLEMMEEMQKRPALDVALFKQAKEEGKEVGALETVDEQLALFESPSREEQIYMLEKTVEQMEQAKDEGVSKLQSMIELYLAGDAAGLMKVITEATSADPKVKAFMIKLLDERNINMALRIMKNMIDHPDQTQFVAVGTAHMPGEKGIIALLERAGYTVRRLKAGDTIAAPEQEPAAVR